MNKTKDINRLFLVMVIWAISSVYILRVPLGQMTENQITVAGEIIFALPVILFILIKRIRIKEWIPFRVIKISTILMSALAAFLLLPLVTFINLFSMLFAKNYVNETSAGLSANPLWLNLLLIAVIPAVIEELIYRGILYHAYREKGVILGSLASGIVFGIMHRNLNQFFYAAVLGIIFCVLIEITGSIFASMTAHFVINGWSVLLLALQTPLQELSGGSAQMQVTSQMLIGYMAVYAIFAVFATALAIGVLIWMTKHCKREPHMRWCFKSHPLPEGVKKSFVTPAFVMAVVLSAAYMIWLEVWF